MATKRSRKTTQPRASEVSRRKFLQDVIAASAATGAAAVLPSAAAAAVPQAAAGAALEAPSISAYQVLTEEQAGLFALVLNRLIPAEGDMPAAGDIALAGYVDNVLVDAPHLRQPLLDILNEVSLASKDDVQSPEKLDALLTRLEHTHGDSFRSMIEAVYTGYYSHPLVLEAIGWIHPGTAADTSETLDVALLEDVVRRGPLYKHV